MSRTTIVEAIESGRTLVSDGAWGTFFQKKGLVPGECPELWSIDRPRDVLEVATEYIEAGADMTQANSFGASSIKLAEFGLAGRAVEINEAAAKLSRQAAGENAWVIASVGPTGKMLLMGDVTEEELYASFAQQAQALERGGADAICIETMSALDEAAIAVRAARETTSLEVICTFSFDRTARGEYRTMMGVSPAQAALSSIEAGAHIIGTNCGNGFERMIEIVRQTRQAAPDAPILVHANAGAPQHVHGQTLFPDTPQDMASLAPTLAQAGANIIGGCCGTTPAHIRAIKKALTSCSESQFRL